MNYREWQVCTDIIRTDILNVDVYIFIKVNYKRNYLQVLYTVVVGTCNALTI